MSEEEVRRIIAEVLGKIISTAMVNGRDEISVSELQTVLDSL